MLMLILETIYSKELQVLIQKDKTVENKTKRILQFAKLIILCNSIVKT